MADNYIDYWEVSEYGRHFVREVARLEVTGNPFVDLAAVKAHILAAVEAVETQRSGALVKGSQTRDQRASLDEAIVAMRRCIQRFFSYLGSLPDTTPPDMDAFFPGGVLGELGSFKPADLLARTDDLLAGFASAKNQALPGIGSWKSELGNARTALADALSDRGAAKLDRQTATAALVQARLDFLRAYHYIAKPAVQMVLSHLDRDSEYHMFFLDLQVNENNKPKEPAPAEPDADAGPADGADASPSEESPGEPTPD